MGEPARKRESSSVEQLVADGHSIESAREAIAILDEIVEAELRGEITEHFGDIIVNMLADEKAIETVGRMLRKTRPW